METAKAFHALLRGTVVEYLSSGQTVHVSNQLVHDKSKARASGLASCELKTAYERLEVAPSNPENTSDINPNLALLLSSGGHLAEMYQGALVWYASQTPNTVVITERTLSNETMIGRIDAYAKWDDHEIIVDFKYTLGQGGDPGSPRYNYGLQLIAYQMMWEKQFGTVPEVALVTIGKGGQFDDVFKVWALVAEGEGYRFYDTTTGEPYKPSYGGKWNSPDKLNHLAVQEFVKRQLDYMETVKFSNAVGVPVRSPIQDVLNDEEGWQCGRKDYKTMTLKPACAYAGLCHGLYQPQKYKKEDGVFTWD